MATKCFPRIHPEHFEEFRRLLGNEIPETHVNFDAWIFTRRATWEEAGHDAAEIEISPGEFIEFVTSTKSEYHLTTLERLASQKCGR